MWKRHALLSALFLSLSLHSQVSVSGKIYSGRVVRGDNHTPVAEATVLLFIGACDPTTRYSRHLVTATSADGTYRFPDVPSDYATVLVYHPGFTVSDGTGLPILTGAGDECQQYSSDSVSLPDINLYPTLSATQMKDGALASAYPTLRNFLEFRAPEISPDGRVFSFVTLDGYANRGPDKAWIYDLDSQTLKPRELPANWLSDESAAETGPYSIDVERDCHGCAFTLSFTASGGAPAPEGKSITITRNLTIGAIESSDGSAVFWGEFNSKGQTVIGMYEFASRRKQYFLPPWKVGFTPLAARREGQGYLLAYSAQLACDPDLNDRISWLPEQFPFGPEPGRYPSHVCFVSLP